MKNSKLNAIKLNAIVNSYNCNNASILYAFLNAKIAKAKMLEQICSNFESKQHTKPDMEVYSNLAFVNEIGAIRKVSELKIDYYESILRNFKSSLENNTFKSFKVSRVGDVVIITE